MFLLEMSIEDDDATHWNPFNSFSDAIENTLSRVQSPISIASHELHRIFHICPVSRSCTITLLTYLRNRNCVLIIKRSLINGMQSYSQSAIVAIGFHSKQEGATT